MEYSIKILQNELNRINSAYERFVEKGTVNKEHILALTNRTKANDLQQAITKLNQALQLHKANASGVNVLEVYSFENVSEEYKKQTIEGFVKLSAKHALQVFRSFGLKVHIETMIIDDNTKEEFIYSFKKVE